MQRRKRILLAPLNWGLGHASRCFPIIRELIKRDVDVLIAAEGGALALLTYEFPELEQVDLKGISIKYPKTGSFIFHFAMKMPQLVNSIRKEHKTLKKRIQEHQIDAVISDNRYGLYHDEIPSVIMTHQLFVESPILRKQIKSLIAKYVSKFDACWIPDYEGLPNLSGKLSHHSEFPENIKFIGPSSRFNQLKRKHQKHERQVLVILSGPEPQRGILEAMLKKQLLNSSYTALIVKGKPEGQKVVTQLSDLHQEVNFLDSNSLQDEIEKSELIICRSGYSSIMDLVCLKKKALLIPTTGQTEQEYLAEYVKKQSLFYTVKEKDFKLENEIKKAIKFKQNFPEAKAANFSFLDDFVAEIRPKQ